MLEKILGSRSSDREESVREDLHKGWSVEVECPEKAWTTVRAKKKKTSGFRDYLWIPTRPAASLPRPGRFSSAVGQVSICHGLSAAPPASEKVHKPVPCQNISLNSNSKPCPAPGECSYSLFGSLCSDSDHSVEKLGLVEPLIRNLDGPLDPNSSAGHTPFNRIKGLSSVNKNSSNDGLDSDEGLDVDGIASGLVAGSNLASHPSLMSNLKPGSFNRDPRSRWISHGPKKISTSELSEVNQGGPLDVNLLDYNSDGEEVDSLSMPEICEKDGDLSALKWVNRGMGLMSNEQERMEEGGQEVAH
ncbi:hypothetical protein NE237_022924 [Protea cynaroides]|uniref:Uncharacterized protein n=1 Tax=Protea cynaroides TaxID=273540 RepID=A0A9Q0HBW8_9MAGN|nr:hypothetical protein NE237_022924 [Protea cynaroides]